MAEGSPLPLPSEIAYASFLVYSPRGVSVVSRRSRTITYGIKNDAPGPTPGLTMVRYCVLHLQSILATSGLADLFGPDVTLVPAPKSAPLYAGGLWPAARICEELVLAGLGRDVLPCLERLTPVPRSASAPPGGRPTPAAHYDTIRARPGLRLEAQRIVLVDDVITKGATCLSCAGRLMEILPGAQLKVFAMVRTLGLVDEIAAIVSPVTNGTIRLDPFGGAEREP